MNAQELPFEVRKLRLQQDCQRRDKSRVYSNLGEDCLRVLWEVGTKPNVQAIIDGGQDNLSDA